MAIGTKIRAGCKGLDDKIWFRLSALSAQCLAFFVLLLLLAPLPLDAQGRSVVALPQMDRTAQGFALGDSGAYLQGLNSLGVNPAGLHTMQPEVMSQYQQLPLQTNLGLFGASYPLRRLQTTIGLTYMTLRSAGFDRRNEFGDNTGSFSTQDQMIGVHVSRPMGLGLANPVSLGVSLKFLEMGIDNQSARAMALDLGGRYRLSAFPLTVGLSVVNLGKGPVMRDSESKLPTSYIFSGAYSFSQAFAILGSLTHHANEGRQEFNLGVQYWVGDMIAFRGRYAMVRDESGQGAGLQNLTAGVGFKLLGRHTLDYAFQPYDSALQQSGAVGSHRLTLTMRFASQGVAAAPMGLTRTQAGAGRWGEDKTAETVHELAQEGLEALRNGQFALASLRLQQALDADPSDRQVSGMLPRLKAVAAIMPRAEGTEGAMAYVKRGVRDYVDGRDLRGAVILLRQAYNAAPQDDRILALLNRVEKEGRVGEVTRKVGGEVASGVGSLDLVGQKLESARGAVYEGRYDVGIRRCREVLDLEPTNERALEIMGSAYYMMGDTAKAKSAWGKALKLDPGNQTLQEYLARVQ